MPSVDCDAFPLRANGSSVNGQGMRHLWADAAYHGHQLTHTATTLNITLQIPTKTRASKGSNPYPAAGSSNEPWPGSAAADAAPATTNASPTTTKPPSTGPPSST
jgi:hypothetical protein